MKKRPVNSKSLISFIIPAYNAEQYIEKCVLSITSQTHKAVEVIIVNDGSTDHTTEIIDSFSRSDQRIKVIHKENAGVSAARNSGLEIAKGDYVVFVDADDYLADDFATYMLKLTTDTNADFCLSRKCFTQKGETQTAEEKIVQLTPEETTALLLSPEVVVGCWNKIYRREFLQENNLRFNEDLFYGEGLLFITTAAQLSQHTGVGNRKVYYYRRNNEVSATTQFNIEKLHSGERALDEIERNLLINSNKVRSMLNFHRAQYSLGAIVRIQGSQERHKYRSDYKRWLKHLRKNSLQFLRSKDLSTYRKLLLIGGCISPWLMMKLDLIRRQRISKNSVE